MSDCKKDDTAATSPSKPTSAQKKKWRQSLQLLVGARPPPFPPPHITSCAIFLMSATHLRHFFPAQSHKKSSAEETKKLSSQIESARADLTTAVCLHP